MLQGIKILAVDDDEMILEMLAETHGSQGANVTAAANGREAMAELERAPDFDIMLLDLQMPIMDGFEVLWHCKGSPYLCDIPIIVLAADQHEKLTSLRLGADDFMKKPYSMEELELRILKLVQSRRLAHGARKAKGDFLASASHELRTPMNRIAGLAELLDGEKPGSEQRELVDSIKEATGSMTDIITDILTYVELDQMAATVVTEPFSLRAVVQGALNSQSGSADTTGVTFEVSIADDVSDALNGPSSYVSKVFGILIGNAVKFCSEGEIRIEILEEPFGKFGSHFCCSVSTVGSGIPDGFQKKIFEPFVQADSSKINGIGRGLAIAQRMVEHMGGTIGVKSEEEMGSSFTFSFHSYPQNATGGQS